MLTNLQKMLFGERESLSPPARVREAIEGQQLGSEILIGWVQLSVVVAFAVLYTFARKTIPADAEFTPVPWALGFYFAFTLVRLLAAHRGKLPRWFLALSVVIDMTLLLGLIWSFHLQYMQPAAFYLKAPTLLYVFIFIALRALRFEPQFVTLAGITAAVGWLALVVFAINSDSANDMITRDYVRYMTSASVLLGAEFDKIISILVVTLILALAIVRARRLLVRAVVESAAVGDLSRFFAPEISRRITASEERIQPGQGELRQAAILQCDIRGFSKLAMERSPCEIMSLLAEYEASMVAVIHHHGGSIDKFLGDGIMATFGAAVRTDSYAADALRAVQDLVGAAEAWRQERTAAGDRPLVINFAVTSGAVVFGAVGDETRLEFTVIGEPVNLAAKLEKHNKVELVGALTTADCLKLAKSQGYVPPVEPELRAGRTIEGIAGALDLVVLAS